MAEMIAQVFVVAGRAGVGKTVFIERLIPPLNAAGLRVATLKLSNSPYDVDYPGRDSQRHLAAGAVRSVLSQSAGLTVFLPAAESLEALIESQRAHCDVLLLEGVPVGDFPVIEVIRVGAPKLKDSEVWLTVTDRTVGRTLEANTADAAAAQILKRLAPEK
jgi:molybdopterin-guanine dinucleotide biosynthesis adapter protein